MDSLILTAGLDACCADRITDRISSQQLCAVQRSKASTSIGFKIINLNYVIGRCGITIQLAASSLAKLIILNPISKHKGRQP